MLDGMDADSLFLRLHPDPVLRQAALPVESIDQGVREIASRMIEVMREERGIGLAAPQVGLSRRIFVCDVPRDEGDPEDESRSWTDGPVVFINPEISDPGRGVEPYEEGCLSLPDIRGDVLRPESVLVGATGLDGERFEWRCSGLLARCIQHENDHLDGVMIIDKFTPMSRLKNRSAIRALERSGGA